ncbi:kinase-like domain-containing protein [Obelidium mucronatum]|nr:kinase-like domain-containing protein [Obelidium mucronatum]
MSTQVIPSPRMTPKQSPRSVAAEFSRRASLTSKVSPASSPAMAPVSTLAIRQTSRLDEHPHDLVYVVPTFAQPAGTKLSISSSPLVNTSAWYQSPHGYSVIDSKTGEAAVEQEMEELTLDRVQSAIQLASLATEEAAAAEIEAERYTFANISNIEIDHEGETDTEATSKPPSNKDTITPLPAITAGKFKWPVLNFRLGSNTAKTLIPSPKSSPLAFLALVSGESLSSHEKKQEYKQLKTLGHGIQGVVTLAVHRGTGKKVALKAIPLASSIDPHVRQSFRKEVALMQEVRNHPNVIRLVDFWEGKQKVYQAFEVCTGGDLDTGLDQVTPMQEPYGARLFAPIIDAVRYLHEFGVLHRDIRPPNVFLRKTLTGNETAQELRSIPVLADFGIATKEGAWGRLGTQFLQRPPHIAPEVVDGERYTKCADVFGLGVCLIRILLGRAIDLDDQNPKLSSREEAWVNLSAVGKLFVRSVLEVDPVKRVTAADALKDPWFQICEASL